MIWNVSGTKSDNFGWIVLNFYYIKSDWFWSIKTLYWNINFEFFGKIVKNALPTSVHWVLCEQFLEALLGFSFRQRMWLRGSSNQSWEAQRQGFIKQSILKHVRYILNENYSLKVSVGSWNCKFVTFIRLVRKIGSYEY